MCVCVFVCICERERKRERNRKRKRKCVYVCTCVWEKEKENVCVCAHVCVCVCERERERERSMFDQRRHGINSCCCPSKIIACMKKMSITEHRWLNVDAIQRYFSLLFPYSSPPPFSLYLSLSPYIYIYIYIIPNHSVSSGILITLHQFCSVIFAKMLEISNSNDNRNSTVNDFTTMFVNITHGLMRLLSKSFHKSA